MTTHQLRRTDAARHGTGDADLTVMLVAHDAFRRDLVSLARAASAADRADPRRREQVGRGWQVFKRQLHFHHTGEDRMIWPRLAPEATPTSSSSGGTSRIAFSTSRAKNGMPARDIGMMAALIPIVVPATSWVNGMIVAISTRNGSERPRLAIQLTTALT